MTDPRSDSVSIGLLHVITDTRGGCDPIATSRAALAAGAAHAPGSVTIQIRVEDECTDRNAYDLAVRISDMCAEYGAACLVNDRIHVGMAVGAHGAHVGVDDLPVGAARDVLGGTAILGATCRDPQSARSLRRAGASYLGVGPAYRSASKNGLPDPLGPDGIGAVAAAVDIPVIAIGGITAERIPDLIGAGAYGIAVIGAVAAAGDPYRATAELLEAIDGRT